MIERLLNGLVGRLPVFLPDPRAHPAWFLAHVGVPSIVLVLGGLTGSGIALHSDSGIAYSPLATKIAGQTATNEPGFVLIVDRTASRFALPLLGDQEAGAWTSLTVEAMTTNSRHVHVDEDSFAIDAMPLLGVREPIVVVGTGMPETELRLPGKLVPLEQLRIPPKESGALAVAGIIAATLGLGMAVGAKEDGLGEQRRRE